MDWSKLLSGKRLGVENYHERKHERTNFQRDYDRLIFSSPFRRLQNKTQVFPLPGSVFVHNRLTHSLEVSCVGRSLGKNVSARLRQKYDIRDIPNLDEIDSIVSAACLAHDMGNPPFGHSGERAIAAYFADGKGKQFENQVRNENNRWEDFLYFEGNANAIRLLTHKFNGRRDGGFALTYSTLASIVKYPFASTHALTAEKRKFGFFQTEEDTFLKIADELGISAPLSNASQLSTLNSQLPRYPLVFLVEAADDICYQIMDIEDAHKLRLMTREEVFDLFFAFFEGKRLDDMRRTMNMVNDVNEQISYLRSCIIGLLVDECTQEFIDNEEVILAGEYNRPLIEGIGTIARDAYRHCSEAAYEKIYVSHEVVDVELAGYYIFGYLLETIIDAMINPTHSYSKLLLNRVPMQYDVKAPTVYGKIQCALDYISGMTDVYALDLYRKITGMSLPAV
ncbi:MAG: dNTP triphosphohydrolase [Tannerella sp.]|jgi:dGTPase|nr:dNTP triphosphohydrolase [Tannerella sp.]